MDMRASFSGNKTSKILKLLLALSLLVLAANGNPLFAESPAAGDVGATRSATPDSTDFSLITTNGFVCYTIRSEWKVLSMQSRPPKTAATFQIPNPADVNTPYSTNFVLMTFESDSLDAMAAFAKVSASRYAEASNSKFGQWELVSQEAKQGPTEYSIRDAWRKTPGAAVFVRLAWPHLPANAKDYDSQMEAIFRSVLDSVSGGIGPKAKKDGEVFRRPADQ